MTGEIFILLKLMSLRFFSFKKLMIIIGQTILETTLFYIYICKKKNIINAPLPILSVYTLFLCLSTGIFGQKKQIQMKVCFYLI